MIQWFKSSNRMHLGITFSLILAFMLMPLVTLPAVADTPFHPTTMSDAVAGDAAGTADGTASAGESWYLAGVCCGIIGTAYAYLDTPSVPPGPCVGKSAEYTTAYHDAYVKAARSAQTRKACTGWAIEALVVIIISASSSSSGG